MKELITIQEQKIGNAEVNSINAREIHEYLEVKTLFKDWIKRAIDKYDFTENEDYIRVDLPLAKNGKKPNDGVYITLT